MTLQKLRFGERLAVEWRVVGVSPSTPFPAFLLQPLIENAIRHGRLRDGEPCTVVVEVTASATRARVEVRNPVGSREPSAGPGVGLRNIEARLGALYPGDFHFAATRDGERFVACADFPAAADAASAALEAVP